MDELNRNQVRFKAIGRIWELSDSLQEELRRDEQLTAANTGMTLYLAINYGGRGEIADAARRIARLSAGGELRPEEIDEESFAAHLYRPEMPDLDLLIRTGGEMRISNFLLWQCAYAELYVTPTLWPDFRQKDFLAALEHYARRERRFGRSKSVVTE